MEMKILWSGRYVHEQAYEQVLETAWIFLNISGMRSCIWREPDARVVYEEKQPGPFLFLGVPGTRFRFSYSKTRENWVCGFTGLEIRQTMTGVELHDQGAWVPLAQHVPLTQQAAQLLGIEMQRIRTAAQTPVPGNAFRARLALAGVLRFLLEARAEPESRSPADRLRALIDADEACRRNLEELSAACGYSSDHLRVLFLKEFHISPQQYRMQRRMARSMDLVMGRAMPIKEIAAHLGFPYVTHFSTAFRKAFGCTPSEAPHRSRV